MKGLGRLRAEPVPAEVDCLSLRSVRGLSDRQFEAVIAGLRRWREDQAAREQVARRAAQARVAAELRTSQAQQEEFAARVRRERGEA